MTSMPKLPYINSPEAMLVTADELSMIVAEELQRAVAEAEVAAPDPEQTNIDALNHAHSWIASAPHGDDCFVSDHHESDPGSQCNCGKDGVLSAIELALEARAVAEPALTNKAPSALSKLTDALVADPEYAWSWHCNLAMPIMDSTKVSHRDANIAAARLMQHIFGIDTAKHAHFEVAAEPETKVDSALADWAAERWHAEVANRPLVNIHRRTLDDTWRQVLRYAGVDDRERLGPTHDELLALSAPKE